MTTEQTHLEIREVVGPENTWHNHDVKVGNYFGVVGRPLRRGLIYPDNKEGLKKIKKKIANEPPRQTTFKLFKVNTEKREFNKNYQKTDVTFVVEIQLRYHYHAVNQYMIIDQVASSPEHPERAVEEANKIIEKLMKKNDIAHTDACEFRLVLRSTTTHQEEISSVSYSINAEDVSHQL